MKIFRLIAIFLVVLLAVYVMSCRDTVDPKVSFRTVEYAGISPIGVNMIAIVDVENPNTFSIPMPKVNWTIYVNNIFFANGVYEERQNIGSGEKVTLGVPVTVGYLALFNTVSSLYGATEAPYKIDMELRFPIPFLELKAFPVSYSGVFPLPQL